MGEANRILEAKHKRETEIALLAEQLLVSSHAVYSRLPNEKTWAEGTRGISVTGCFIIAEAFIYEKNRRWDEIK